MLLATTLVACGDNSSEKEKKETNEVVEKVDSEFALASFEEKIEIYKNFKKEYKSKKKDLDEEIQKIYQEELDEMSSRIAREYSSIFNEYDVDYAARNYQGISSDYEYFNAKVEQYIAVNALEGKDRKSIDKQIEEISEKINKYYQEYLDKQKAEEAQKEAERIAQEQQAQNSIEQQEQSNVQQNTNTGNSNVNNNTSAGGSNNAPSGSVCDYNSCIPGTQIVVDRWFESNGAIVYINDAENKVYDANGNYLGPNIPKE